VKPFHLPKTQQSETQQSVPPPSLSSFSTGDHHVSMDEVMGEPPAAMPHLHPRDSPLHFVEDVEIGEISVEVSSRRSKAAPKSMRELAEDNLKRQTSETAASSEPNYRSSPPSGGNTRGGIKAQMKSGTKTPSTRNSSVKRKNGRKRIREDNKSASEDDHRFDAAASPRGGDSMMGTPNTTSGRVLRPRPQKTAAKLREEVELERAFRRATAE